jgi:hypothetical protein
MIKKCQNPTLKKVDGSWFFDLGFFLFGPKMGLYGFIENQAPQKALCLGPHPPPDTSRHLIEFDRSLSIFGSSKEPEKPSVKSASTPYPPWKVIFMVIFNNSRPNLAV